MEEKFLFDLMEKFEKSTLTELAVEEGNFKIKLKRQNETIIQADAPLAHAATVNAQTAKQATPTAAAEKTESGNETIDAPLVGTFYRSPAPDAEFFVEVGSKVKAGDPLCILEAMKVMNKLEAEFDCKILKILPENAEMVEFGSPLFEVKRV